MILAEVFCANLGGSATMCGDPPNIIIGTSLHYSFTDFLLNTGLFAGISLIFVLVYFWLMFRKKLVASESAVEKAAALDPKDAIKNKKDFTISAIIFGLAVVLLVTHATTELSVATIGLGIAILTLIVAGKKAVTLIKRVDYKTLLFFVGLFIVVGGLEQTKVLVIIAQFIENISHGNNYLMVAIVICISAFASAFVDNIPFAATMVPVIMNLTGNPANPELLRVLSWGLAMGTDIGGSATPIGASANVVGISTAENEGYHIGWGKYCAAATPATIIVLVIATVGVCLRYAAILG
ncbi:MAG: citrate transporter, partial [Eubacterium sp.]|nr:citrate transporter [Eubacterium sp.]